MTVRNGEDFGLSLGVDLEQWVACHPSWHCGIKSQIPDQRVLLKYSHGGELTPTKTSHFGFEWI